MPTKDPTKRAKDGAGAYKSKLQFINGGIIEDESGNKTPIEGYNKKTYDRVTFNMPKGYKDKLHAYMKDRIEDIAELEKIEDRTPEQHEELERLQSMYQLSTRGEPSLNTLIIKLLEQETGIQSKD